MKWLEMQNRHLKNKKQNCKHFFISTLVHLLWWNCGYQSFHQTEVLNFPHRQVEWVALFPSVDNSVQQLLCQQDSFVNNHYCNYCNYCRQDSTHWVVKTPRLLIAPLSHTRAGRRQIKRIPEGGGGKGRRGIFCKSKSAGCWEKCHKKVS